MATIIRATDQNRAASSVAFNFDDMADQARQYLEKIRAEAAQIIVQAQKEAAIVRQRAEKEGQQAAMAATEQMIQRQLGNVLPALKQAIADIQQSRQAWLAHWEAIGLHVAAALAERITRGELSRRPEIPLALIREALQLAAGSPQVQLHLNPADHLALGEQAKLIMQEIAKLGDAKIVADPNVSVGGCRVETRFGTIDQQFEAQLARIEEELRPMMPHFPTAEPLAELLRNLTTTAITGTVSQTAGMTISAAGFPAPVGALAEIHREAAAPLLTEVIGFDHDKTLLYPLADLSGIRHGNRVRLVRTARSLRVGEALLGRVLNASGRAIDGKPQPLVGARIHPNGPPPHACSRPRIDQPLSTGIRALDALLTCGKGQRMGIFAGSGVGKSVTLGMMARYTSADVNVIALIGERGREVNDFIERDLGPAGLARSVVVVATSDEPALLRVHAAATASAIAEFFRDRGSDVLLMMDSVTRFAMAQREIGLAAGEPPATRGYPPSVFALLPRLIERAGRTPLGSITAFYTVLVEGDDHNEPIADAVRGLLDGHTWLSRSLASRGHYPAIDVLPSLSRLMPEVTSDEHRRAATQIRELLSAYRENEDLIAIGAYRRGANRVVDTAIDLRDEMNQFLRQQVDQPATFQQTLTDLAELARKAVQRFQANSGGKAS